MHNKMSGEAAANRFYESNIFRQFEMKYYFRFYFAEKSRLNMLLYLKMPHVAIVARLLTGIHS